LNDKVIEIAMFPEDLLWLFGLGIAGKKGIFALRS
jgi:hypothetical protein